MDTSSVGLFVVFLQEFRTERIFELGWEAARQWTSLVSVLLMMLAIAIRALEEKQKAIADDKANYHSMVSTTFFVVLAVGLYHGIAWLVINFAHALWESTSTGAMAEVGRKLDGTLEKLWEKDYSFRLSDIGDGIFSIFGFLGYWTTHILQVTVTLFMRLAHTLIMSFTLFWGAVALPASITIGLKQITAFKTLAVLVIVWPIVENFLMFLVSGSFLEMLYSSRLDIDNFETVNAGTAMFFYTVFAIINVLLAAVVVAAPFIAYAVANNSGNVTGAITTFAGAGIGAGLMAAKMMTKGGEAREKLRTMGNVTEKGIDGLTKGIGAARDIAGMGPTVGETIGAAKGMIFGPPPPNYSGSSGVGLSSGNPSPGGGSSPNSTHNKAPDLSGSPKQNPAPGYSTSTGVGMTNDSGTRHNINAGKDAYQKAPSFADKPTPEKPKYTGYSAMSNASNTAQTNSSQKGSEIGSGKKPSAVSTSLGMASHDKSTNIQSGAKPPVEKTLAPPPKSNVESVNPSSTSKQVSGTERQTIAGTNATESKPEAMLTTRTSAAQSSNNGSDIESAKPQKPSTTDYWGNSHNNKNTPNKLSKEFSSGDDGAPQLSDTSDEQGGLSSEEKTIAAKKKRSEVFMGKNKKKNNVDRKNT